MLAALVASIHKTEPPGDQVLEVLAVCCLPQLLGQTAAVGKLNQDQVKSSQVSENRLIGFKAFIPLYWFMIIFFKTKPL